MPSIVPKQGEGFFFFLNLKRTEKEGIEVKYIPMTYNTNVSHIKNLQVLFQTFQAKIIISALQCSSGANK